jgi:hypothetical protein
LIGKKLIKFIKEKNKKLYNKKYFLKKLILKLVLKNNFIKKKNMFFVKKKNKLFVERNLCLNTGKYKTIINLIGCSRHFLKKEISEKNIFLEHKK